MFKLLRNLSRIPILVSTRNRNQQHAPIHTVVMLRHGESLWNVENRFTGWCDVPLTPHGEAEAIDAGHLMGDRGIKFDVAFTSNLERAWRTCALALASSGQSSVETIRSSSLNERHYGALQGLQKNSPQLIAEFGEEKVMEWRRSYTTAPPSLYDADFLDRIGPSGLLASSSTLNEHYIDSARLHEALGHSLPNAPSLATSVFTANAHTEKSIAPTTESLRDCEERAYGYWQEVIAPRVAAGERVLIVAHANTIRALVKAVDRIDDEKIAHLKIPNGIPLIYTLNEKLEPADVPEASNDIGFQGAYMVSARNHSKMMRYEQCVRKKLRSLFEYLDTDGDGKITQQCLLHGLARLHSHSLAVSQQQSGSGAGGSAAGGSVGSAEMSQQCAPVLIPPGAPAQGTAEGIAEGEPPMDQSVCEYSIEELIRCVPDADEHGAITLKAFLDAEATLLPRLTHLKLLQ